MACLDWRIHTWVIGVCVVFSAVPLACGFTDPRDVYAINQFYANLGSPLLPGWIPGPGGGDPCGPPSWQGVECVNANITAIKLSGSNLGGALSEDLGSFATIITLDLSNNHIGGPIPTNLPTTVMTFDLSDNQFGGRIPDTLSSCGLLGKLSLKNNRLAGPIPDVFESLTDLTSMDLSGNSLTNELPSSMGNLSYLLTLHLQNNQLTGVLDVLQDLPLTDLDIENNLFSGPIPPKLLTIPDFRQAGNPFNTTVIPSPPASPPSLTPSEAPSHQYVAQVPLHGPPVSTVSPPSQVSGKTKNRTTWIAIGGLLVVALLVLVLCLSVFRCCKKMRFSEKTANRHEMYGGTLMGTHKRNTSWQNPFIQEQKASKHVELAPAGGSQTNTAFLKHGKDHSIDMTGLDDVSSGPLPFPLLPAERVVSDPTFTSITMRENASKIVESSKFFTIASLQQYTDSFSQENLIGKGTLGSVYRAQLPNGKVLAVKKLDKSASGHLSDREFLELVSRISKIHHENIVELVGYCLEHGQRLLVYNYCRNGTLDEALYFDDGIDKKLLWNARMRLALQAAKALEYLHEVCNPPSVHRNFKSCNVLLEDDLSVQVSDCGLSPLLSTNSMAQMSSQQEVGESNNIQAVQIPPVDGASNDHSTSSNAQATSKRKPIRPRSVVWDHFSKVIDDAGRYKSAKCNYCHNEYASQSRKNGTSSLLSHMNSCIKNPHNAQTRQTLLNLQPKEEGNSGIGTLTTWKYDYHEIRESIAYMVIVDELPFKFVEGKGFNRVMSKACPKFKIPSRWAVTRDCYDLYVKERSKLKSFLKTNCQRVCLTTDTWTSLQKINYMCITAHFIDNEWNLHKKILNFVPVTSHKGDYIGKSLETCVLDWGLKNVFTITVDNASSNDTAVAFLKKRMMNWGGTVANCKYLHMRCIAHVINLIVTEGMKDVKPSVKRVRKAVRYIRNSPARLRKFKECVEWEGIESKSLLCLDVTTRWNSTYLMLNTASKFEKAFDRYESEDTSFVGDLGRDGVPTGYDWSCVRKISDLLKYFYDTTLRISGCLYITSNNFFSEVSDLCCILTEWKKSDDPLVKDLGDSMKSKFDKYWGEPEKMNKIIFWANILDPRDKFEYMTYSLCEMYGAEKGNEILKNVKGELFELFGEYKNKYQAENGASVSNGSGSNSSTGGGSDCESVTGKPSSFLKAKYKKQKLQSGGFAIKKSELEFYLNEDVIEGAENLDVLKWWKINSERFPVLTRMARDMLCVPISTVASESAFSTGGRILDRFRSSLTPKIVEALICAQDWLRNENLSISVEEQLDELENFERDLPTVGIGQSTSNTKT